ncbi:MAG: HAMP domain-containing protein [Candidatus Izimaplasma sp.]|nr:HAMP domain-containing protein [Candidatus Izimaplasma bacterium]
MMKFNIKNSFIKRLFFSLILIYLFVFILLFIFQGIIFRSYYTRKTVDNTKNEISDLIDTITTQNISEKIVEFSQDTQTTSIFVPYLQIQDDISQLSLNQIEVLFESNVYTIYVPSLSSGTYREGDEIVASLYFHEDSGNYVPILLRLNGSRIISGKMNTINPVYTDLISGLDTSIKIHITGEISNISNSDIVMNNPINPIISNEILNIVTKNYDSLIEFENGYYYYTSNDESDLENLVFVANKTIDGESFVLISVFPMSHIEDIVSAVRLVNIYIFSIVLVLLIAFSFIYSKEFSKPLLLINKATKEMSNLNFDIPITEVKTQDEFSELAKNINTLSFNLKNTLERLNEQNKQLSVSLDRENKNENTRRDFVSGMSHEIKTPLSVIQASAEALEKNIFETEVEKKDTLNLIQKEVQRTNKLINNMITIYNLDNPEYTNDWQEVNLANIVRNTEESLRILYSNSNITVNLQLEDSIVMADQLKMELIINNLLTNALKYTPKNNKIEIKLENKDTYIFFEIINYGINIEDDKLEKLFEAFYRVDKSRSRLEGSTGLGLYIVQQTLSQYNSECIAKNSENGVSFSFKIKK